MKQGDKITLKDGRTAKVVQTYARSKRVAITVDGKNYGAGNTNMDIVAEADIQPYREQGMNLEAGLDDDTHLFCGQCEECCGEDSDDVRRDLEEGWLSDINHNNGN